MLVSRGLNCSEESGEEVLVYKPMIPPELDEEGNPLPDTEFKVRCPPIAAWQQQQQQHRQVILIGATAGPRRSQTDHRVRASAAKNFCFAIVND